MRLNAIIKKRKRKKERKNKLTKPKFERKKEENTMRKVEKLGNL